MTDFWDAMERVILTYVDGVRTELSARWDNWKLDLTQPELHEVVGALLARQVTLATQLATSVGIWNAHVAPILLRSMTDVHINLAWILKDPLERSRRFVGFGLGQQKLITEHRKSILTAQGLDPKDDPVVNANEAWLNSQRWGFLTVVNVGSWSDVKVREMAQDAGCLDLYQHAYTPFSAATHSMWHHISRLNLRYCENPLHRYHKVPGDPEFVPDPDYFFRAASYVEKSFKLFDGVFSVNSGTSSAFEKLRADLEQLQKTFAPEGVDSKASGSDTEVNG